MGLKLVNRIKENVETIRQIFERTPWQLCCWYKKQQQVVILVRREKVQQLIKRFVAVNLVIHFNFSFCSVRWLALVFCCCFCAIGNWSPLTAASVYEFVGNVLVYKYIGILTWYGHVVTKQPTNSTKKKKNNKHRSSDAISCRQTERRTCLDNNNKKRFNTNVCCCLLKQ